MTRPRLCFDLPGDMQFYGDPEALVQIWSTIGYTTQVAANMDQSIALLLAGLNGQPIAPVKNTTDAIRRIQKGLYEKSYGTRDFQRFAESALTAFADFQGRRSRFVHDQVFPSPTAPVRVQHFGSHVEHSPEPLENLIEIANRVRLLVAQLNTYLLDMTTGGLSETPGSTHV